MHPYTHTHEQTAVAIYSARAWLIFDKKKKKKKSKGQNVFHVYVLSNYNIAGQQKHMNESFRVVFLGL